ncbi:MAG: tetratricopeptide repeat protein [Desulfosarcinaceae bacterium]|nr:tetratricopeptide repeat protein [Desulfosarcinaceae bacterium]
MASKVKKSRKELLHEPDEFMVLTGRLVSFLRSYQQQVLYGVLAIILLLGSIAVIRFVADRNEDKAAHMWAKIKTAHQSALQTSAGDPAGPQTALAAVDADFKQLIETYGSKRTGKLARLHYAQLCLSAGRAEAALPHFKASLKAFGDDPAWRDVVLAGLGHALAQTGDHEQSVARFEEIVAGEAGAMTAEALFQLGWLYAKTGAREKGREAYERLVTDFPDSAYTELARDQIRVKMDS